MFNFSTWVKLLIICNITAIINKKIRVEFAMKTGRDFIDAKYLIRETLNSSDSDHSSR